MPPRETAYYSNADIVIATWKQKNEEHAEHRKRLFAQLAEWGLGESRGFHTWGNVLGSRDLIDGVIPIEGQQPPEGWRVDRKSGAWVPKLTTKRGKELKEELEDIQPPSKLLTVLPGMPDVAMNGHRVYSPGMFVLDKEGFTDGPTMYLHWATAPDHIDADLWHEIKVSAWYLAKEAYEEQQKVSADV